MGKMSFLLPSHLPADLVAELLHSCLAGGFDNSPVPTHVRLDGNRLELSRAADESGYWLTPWDIGECGRLILSSTTLIERPEPYQAAIELARGKLNILRNALSEWQGTVLRFSDSVTQEVQQLSRTFAQALIDPSSPECEALAVQVLRQTLQLIHQIVPQFVEQALLRRKLSQPRFGVDWGCYLSEVPALADEFIDTFNTVCLPLAWRDIEPAESKYAWEASDQLLAWAEANQLRVIAGPLIDFSGGGLPDWLSLWEGDIPNLANFMCDYVETIIHRYGSRIRRWHLTTGANLSQFLNLNEDETLFLTAKLAETALHKEPSLELVIGVAQPWGEYLAREEYTYTPLVFVDQLLRAGLRVAAIDLELIAGVSPRGSYCRDLLEVYRLLEHYSELGVPIQLTLGFPTSTEADAQAYPKHEVLAGRWREGYTPDVQAEWAEQVASLALSRTYVSGVHWTHFSDADKHRFPNCGIVDANNQVKPALVRLSRLRARHLN